MFFKMGCGTGNLPAVGWCTSPQILLLCRNASRLSPVCSCYHLHIETRRVTFDRLSVERTRLWNKSHVHVETDLRRNALQALALSKL